MTNKFQQCSIWKELYPKLSDWFQEGRTSFPYNILIRALATSWQSPHLALHYCINLPLTFILPGLTPLHLPLCFSFSSE
jgi:hypothetical protein